VNAGH